MYSHSRGNYILQNWNIWACLQRCEASGGSLPSNRIWRSNLPLKICRNVSHKMFHSVYSECYRSPCTTQLSTAVCDESKCACGARCPNFISWCRIQVWVLILGPQNKAVAWV